MLKEFNVFISSKNLDNQILTSFNFMCKKLNYNTSLQILSMFDMRSLIKFILAGLKESNKFFLKEYCQGKRSEIGPIKSLGFGEYMYQKYMLIYGNIIFTWDLSERIKEDRLFIYDDYNKIFKILTLLKDKGNWDIKNIHGSISIKSLIDKLIEFL